MDLSAAGHVLAMLDGIPYASTIRNVDNVELLDGMELRAFVSHQGRYTFDELASALEIQGESDHGKTISESDADVDSLAMAVDNEIRLREQELGSSYPFEYSDAGVLSLRKGWAANPSHVAYMFCLLVGSAARNGALHGSLGDSKTIREARKLFQIVATVATAGIVGGPTYSFGFPRPDRSGLHAKLKAVWRKCKDGVVRVKPKRRRANDAGVDVVSWEARPDRVSVHRSVVFGQAATGANFRDKPFWPDIKAFLEDWFSERPKARIEAWTLVPFVIGDDEAKRYVHHLGGLAGRQLVALRVSRGMELVAAGVTVEQAEDWSLVRKWVVAARRELRKL